MEKLTLPFIKGKLPPARWLTMDDYIKFVNLHLNYTLDRKAYRKWKRESSANISFFLR
jgi:hypothetical protein